MAKQKPFFKILKLLLKITAGFFLLAVASALLLFIIFFRDMPRPEDFAEGLITQSTRIYDRTGQVLLYEIAGQEKRTYLTLAQIPEHLQQAFLTAEDRGFYQHSGVELKAIFRALIYDLKLGKPAQGGSTISQQLIRAYFLSQNKTIKRKTREVILTLELERRYDKDQILEWYLNIIPFGSIFYGVESASQSFFNKPAAELSLAQSAVLAGLIRAPSALSPYGEQVETLLKIKDNILTSMASEGFISQEEAEGAKAEKIVFSKVKNPIKAPHFVMFLRDYLEKKYTPNYLSRAGLTVITTLDWPLQEKAEQIIKEKVKALDIYNAHNAGLVAINPKTGELLTMVGSKDYFGQSFPDDCASGKDCLFDPQVNVSIAKRQPGSAFKPFAYLTAFEKGLTPDTLIWDVKTEFNLKCSAAAEQEKDSRGLDCYHPRNYDGQYKGLMTLREALAQSRNLPSVKVLYIAGISETIKLAQSFGITTLTDPSRFGLALVLGGGEVKLLEMTSAYAAFANDGVKMPLNFIKEIRDADGKVLEKSKTSQIKILPAQTVRLLNDVLSDNAARAPLFGWNSQLNIPDYQVAVKTGSTQKLNDAWAIGYSPTVAVGVWVGNNDNSPTKKPGVSLAGPIWNPFMKEALAKFPKETFPEPEPVLREKPMLNGQLPEAEITEEGESYSKLWPHTLLHFIDKASPLGPPPQDPAKTEPAYLHWEFALRQYLGLAQTTSTQTVR